MIRPEPDAPLTIGEAIILAAAALLFLALYLASIYLAATAP